ncbi:MAG: ATP-dependent DNA helicase DinG [Chlamydiae bacterium]|nr:ATP-dependent DNA helicase DinG [Chlamydiota bacterium]
MVLDPKKISDLLKVKSPLSKHLNRFEERAEQLEMLSSVITAYNEQKFALIEAGTGVGKSLAYLLPALYSSLELGERTVISTHTITLQEQLMQKDIPFLLEALGLEVEVALVKGMGNYLCLRKLYDLLDHASSLNISEREDLQAVEKWAQDTVDGSSSDLKKAPKNLGWDRLHCESEACSFIKCPHYKECFFFKARKKIKDAKLLIANHHLLMVDLQSKDLEDSKSGILLDYDHLILDEAHTLEDIATSALAQYTSSQLILRKLNDLTSDKNSAGKLQRLKQKLSSFQDELRPKIWDRISFEIFSEKKQVEVALTEAFLSFDDFLFQAYPSSSNTPVQQKMQLTEEMLLQDEWLKVKDDFILLIAQLTSFSTSLDLLYKELEALKKDLVKSIENLLIDIKACASFLEKSATILTDYFNAAPSTEKLYVIDWNSRKGHMGIQLSIIHLNIADILSEKLFYPLSSAVLCSATLNHSNRFDFVKHQLGLSKDSFKPDDFIEKILPSPFNYEKQVLLAIPKDIPYPQSPYYLEVICKLIEQALRSSKGGAFVLFTSFKMLKDCYERLLPILLELKLLPLKQGDENRSVLLDIFKENENTVLFGTDTFWEGIDVPGFHLRQVILTKLPFPVPTEPIFQAKCKQIESQGLNPFMDYSIPKAIVKFKQGFGRLIRNHQDFGCILCLDSRLLTKSYGKIFINSLPKCQSLFGSTQEVQDAIDNFFAKRLHEKSLA